MIILTHNGLGGGFGGASEGEVEEIFNEERESWLDYYVELVEE